ncbi:putative phage abortive infection protein [Rhizobium giardinii]|uniref:putative phage abortive infection protein n=1 Tax=Rhizobium giardinii TaxID=56731 RepID=UPI003D6FF3B0
MRTVWVVSAALILAAAWLAWVCQYLLFQLFGHQWESATLGQWGDTFGALNALFSALAFVAVLFTLKQQRDDLARQQKQILAAERDQHLQRFERTFYELLRLLREARDDVQFRYSSEYLNSISSSESKRVRVAGTEAFKRAQFELLHWIEVAETSSAKLSSDEFGQLYIKRVHSRYESTLGPYFRLLYTLLMRIHEDKVLKDIEKHRFGNLLRSQLTSHEVALCCYNGLAAVSGSFKGLVTEFRLPKYLPEEFGRNHLMRLYPESAFSGRD